MELLQNADDAGATRLCLALDGAHHPTHSILGPGMALWQVGGCAPMWTWCCLALLHNTCLLAQHAGVTACALLPSSRMPSFCCCVCALFRLSGQSRECLSIT